MDNKNTPTSKEQKLNQFLSKVHNAKGLLAVAAATAILVGCGGGNNACSDQSTITLSGTGYPKSLVLAVNQPMASITPNVGGIPASCEGSKQFAFQKYSFDTLPDGLTLNPATGTISGTPTTRSPVIANASYPGGFYTDSSFVTLVLKLPGYEDATIGSISITVK